MSITARQALTADIRAELGDLLTATQLQQAMDRIEQRLRSYDVDKATAHGTAEADELLQAFIAAKRIEGRSEKTLLQYSNLLKRLLRTTGIAFSDMTVFTLRRFLGDLKNDGTKDRTLEGYRSIFSSFFGWLAKEQLIANNPCANLGAIKCRKEVRYPFSATDIAKLNDACDNIRDRAIIAVLCSTGCRVSELVGIDRDDIDLQAQEITVLGKGNKERVVYLDDVASMWTAQYLDSRTDDLQPLFVSKQKKRMDDTTIRLMLHKLGDKAGVEDVHPHRFRRTLATNLINRGMSIQEVARILGHDNINTTMTYVYTDQIILKNNYHKYAS